MIYTWLQVNGVSVADPSPFDMFDLLFILMSVSLVLFFHFFHVSSKPLLPSVISLERKKKSALLSSLLNKTLSFFHSLSHLHFFLRHPHTMLSIGKHWPIQPVWFSLLSNVRWSITIWWFLLQACPSGSGGRILYSSRYGQFQHSTSFKKDYNFTQVWFIMICLSFEGNVNVFFPPFLIADF